jgi:hypothetical protein
MNKVCRHACCIVADLKGVLESEDGTQALIPLLLSVYLHLAARPNAMAAVHGKSSQASADKTLANIVICLPGQIS